MNWGSRAASNVHSPIRDGTAPSVAILGPTNNTRINPAEPLGCWCRFPIILRMPRSGWL